MIRKVWSFWTMTGRWQHLTDDGSVNPTKPRLIERAWVHQVNPPFWSGEGLSVRLGPWAVRFGLCEPMITEEDVDLSFEDECRLSLVSIDGDPFERAENYKPEGYVVNGSTSPHVVLVEELPIKGATDGLHRPQEPYDWSRDPD